MVREILSDIFDGDPEQFKVLKEFNVTKDYLLYLVAEEEGQIVGCIALKKIDKDTVRLKRMYVKKGYEGKGIAQRLLNKMSRYATDSGYKYMKFSTYPIMENAQKFHKKNGFRETNGNDSYQIHVVKNLQPQIIYMYYDGHVTEISH